MTVAPSFVKTLSKLDVTLESDDTEDFKIIKTLAEARNNVYVVYSQQEDAYKVLKVFPHHKGKPSLNYQNETQFSFLNHPNVIRIYSHDDQTNISKFSNLNGRNFNQTSSVIMEYAPFGTFFELLRSQQQAFSDKIICSYFHQLIEGLEYLHQNEVAHLDIKLENLGVGEKYQLKIIDFDLCCKLNNRYFLSRGTRDCRAPELANGTAEDFFACDVFSAGIILFMFKSKGFYPFREPYDDGRKIQKEEQMMIDLFDCLEKDPEAFWKTQASIHGTTPTYFSAPLQNLVKGMCARNPKERLTIPQIKKSSWYNQPVYSPKELEIVMRRYVQKSQKNLIK